MRQDLIPFKLLYGGLWTGDNFDKQYDNIRTGATHVGHHCPHCGKTITKQCFKDLHVAFCTVWQQESIDDHQEEKTGSNDDKKSTKPSKKNIKKDSNDNILITNQKRVSEGGRILLRCGQRYHVLSDGCWKHKKVHGYNRAVIEAFKSGTPADISDFNQIEQTIDIENDKGDVMAQPQAVRKLKGKNPIKEFFENKRRN
jgi:uncharacterized Zn finger protein (UPF0148 family)